jgi:2-polyprenyl-3-methyl-5-hydroxy-6-metoxy-1,4-benzoquinol methylase
MGDHLSPSDRILEVGGGWGINANFLYGRGYKNIVVNEFDDQIMRVLYKDIVRIGKSVTDMESNHDFVFMSHVLEHFYEPVAKLAHMRRMLGSGGRMFIEVPNCANPTLLHTSRRTFHYWFFDKSHVESLLEQAGFSILRSACFGKDQRISDLNDERKRALSERVQRGETTMREMAEDDPRALWVRVLARVP